jgi:D-sedoheptulose 7-phosphate isomerase
MPFGDGPETRAALEAAVARGCLPVVLRPPAEDPFVAQEVAETAYHVLWELVHVFFEHRGLLAGREAGPVHDTGASSFLYPFLGERETDLEAVLADVRASAVAKAAEATALRAQTLQDNRATLEAVARALRDRLDAGGTLLALGNGGSATDAMDAAADLRAPPAGRGWPARRALDLSEDPAILTAVANDVGTEAMFARQVIAYGGPGDALLAFSTSGGSANVIAALEHARRRGLLTIAMVGYDGGPILGGGLADHIVVTRSEHIPRIQEAQASSWHVARELIEEAR